MQKDVFTIVVFPGSTGSPKRIQLPKKIVKIFLISALSLVVLLGGSFFYFTTDYMQMREDHHGLIHRTLQTCGDYGRLRLFWAEAIVISSPEGAKTVLPSKASASG